MTILVDQLEWHQALCSCSYKSGSVRKESRPVFVVPRSLEKEQVGALLPGLKSQAVPKQIDVQRNLQASFLICAEVLSRPYPKPH